MNRGVVLGLVAVLAAPTAAIAQASLERGRYLVDTVMTCHNCHTPMGPNGPQVDKALSGGLRFDEPAFDVIASNITPDRNQRNVHQAITAISGLPCMARSAGGASEYCVRSTSSAVAEPC